MEWERGDGGKETGISIMCLFVDEWVLKSRDTKIIFKNSFDEL